MKKYLFNVTIFCIALFFTACGKTRNTQEISEPLPETVTTEVSSEDDTVTYDIGNITLLAPSSWLTDSSDDYYYFYPSLSDEVSAMLAVTVSDLDSSVNLSSEESNALFEAMNTGFTESDLSLESSEIVNSAPYPCEYITGTQVINNVSYNVEGYVVLYDSDAYIFFMYTDVSEDISYSNELLNIVSSIIYNSSDSYIEDAKPDTEDIESDEEESNEPELSIGQKNALSKAYDYLNYSAFSKKGLIEQLEYEGFSTEEAEYAVENCGANWKEQAAKKAQDYIDYTSFSRSGLIEQLEYEGFTKKQAEYGADAVGY